MNDITKRSDRDLLVELIGERNTTVLYNNTLRPLFCAEESAPAYAKNGHRSAHRKLMIARELVTRCLAEELPERDLLTSPAICRAFLQARLSLLGREAFACVFLDTRHHLIHFEILFLGSIDSATVHPREIVKTALRHNASAIILAHNHPSGVAEPSSADHAITRRVVDALALVDVRVLDHVVVGATDTVSMAEKGLM